MKNLRLILLTAAVVIFLAVNIRAQVSVNTDGSSPHTSAMLEVKSTSKGLLIPRMTTAQRTTLGAIATAGLMVYDTDLNKFYYYTSAGWLVGTTGEYWTRSGSLLYPTSVADFVGIGTSTPARTLEVRNSDWRSARFSSSTLGASLELVGTATTDWALTNWSNALYLESSDDDFATRASNYFFSKTAFYPWTDNTNTLGISGKRWSTVYGIDANFTGKGAVGTNTYLGNLHVHEGTGPVASLYVTPATTGSGDSSFVLLAEDNTGYYGMRWLYDGSGNQMELWGKAGSTFYGPHFIVNRNDGNAAFGSTLATGYKLSVDGKIICEEVRVNMSEDWPDYVFDRNYPLLPAEELGQYIEENGHLPNIPPAGEIEGSGLDVGRMQRLMMEKIEELSLYIIDQQKQIRELKEKIGELEKK